MLLLKSIPKSIMAEVAIKTSVFKLNAASTIPLIAPPVPKSPAINPDKTPPEIELVIVGFIAKCLKIKKIRLVIIKKQARNISKVLVGMYLLKIPPSITNNMAGIPTEKMSFLSNPFLKKTILVMLLDTWKMAVIPSTE